MEIDKEKNLNYELSETDSRSTFLFYCNLHLLWVKAVFIT